MSTAPAPEAPGRPRVLFLHSSDELYGADRMLLEIADAARSDVDVQVWLPTDLAHPTHPLCVELEGRGIAVRHVALPILRRALRTPVGMLTLLRRSAALVSTLRKTRPQAVYCVTSAALLAAPVARLTRVPTVMAHFQEIWSATDRRILGTLARACHCAIAISDAVGASLPAGLRARTTVVLNGTPEPADTAPLEGRHGPLQFLVASRWNAWKGHATLLRAWDRADSPGLLVVLGGPPPSGDAVDVPRIVSGLHRPESVAVTGEVSSTSDAVLAADVVIMPSDQPEPFGLVAIEAFARSRPVIASAAGGLVEIVTPGRDGWLFPPGAVDALATILRTLTRADVEAAGREAGKTYREKFTSKAYAERWRRAVLPAITSRRH